MIGLLFVIFSSLSFALDIPVFDGVYPGKNYTCGHTSKSVNCWGNNDYQQSISIDDLSNIKKIELEERYGCVLDEVGINCWGVDAPDLLPEMMESENIANFDTSSSGVCAIIDSKIKCVGTLSILDYPKDLNQVTSLGINYYLGCAVSEGKLHCWGDRARDNSNKLFEIPNYLGHVLTVSVSTYTICVLNTKSEVICWGYEQNGKPMKPNFQVSSVVASNFTACMLGSNGEFKCLSDAPKLPASLGRITKLTGQDDGSYCVVDERKRFHCWGFYSAGEVPPVVKKPLMMALNQKGSYFVNESQELFGAGKERTLNVLELKNVSFLSARYTNVCFIDDNGPKCVGESASGETNIPNDIENVTALFPGDDTVCAIITDGKVRCWGNGRYGKANPPKHLRGVKKIVSGEYFFCSLNDGNSVNCWGLDVSPPAFDPSLKVLDISAGANFACALFHDQSIQCWGSKMPAYMTPPNHLYDLKGLIGGDRFACAYSATEVFCWGEADDNKLIAPKVKGTIHFISAGNKHSCLMDDEAVKCWGNNANGQFQFFTN